MLGPGYPMNWTALFGPTYQMRRNYYLNLWMVKEVTSHVNIVLNLKLSLGTRCTLSGLVAIFLLKWVMFSITIESKLPVEYLLMTSYWQEEEKEKNNESRKVGRTTLTTNFYGSSSMKYI